MILNAIKNTLEARAIEEIRTLTGEDFNSLSVDEFAKFLKNNIHLTTEIAYSTGLIQGFQEVIGIEFNEKLESFLDQLNDFLD